MPEKVTVPRIRSLRDRREKIVCITAYDYVSGAIADAADVDLILVGDSVGNVVLGYESTLPVTLEEMLHHLKSVRRGVRRALLVADMPFGSYGGSVAQAVDSACLLMKAGAEAVKLEGSYPEEVEAMVKAGIPVMGHVGMTPQSVNNFGGHRVQGKGEAGDQVLAAALAVAEAGAFSVVLELVPAALAARITEQLPVATIGIGAGAGC
ncbi:MAG TPA: 3-methyl-2-oxobutanoate hydroxymethyltransferase, partial [Fimbriimonas sp.]